MSLSKSVFAILVIAGAVATAQQQPPPAPPPSPPAPVPRILQTYKSVTTERLKKPEDNDWLMVRRTYDGWGYSPLKQITTANVEPAAAGVGDLDRRARTATRRRRSSTTA